MESTILLNRDEDTRQVEEEEKSKFIRYVLEQMGLPVDDFWTAQDRPLKIEEKIRLRELLSAYGIIIIDDLDGHLQMYVENDLTAEWHKPTYILKKDLRQIDPRKKIYLEMKTKSWSVFDENEG